MERQRQPRRLADELYEALKAVVEQELPVGAKLPAETSLAERFGVSRPTIRETLARLRDDGLISSRRGSGSFVSERGSELPERINAAFSEIDSFHQIKQCYEFRKAIEGEAAFIAAENHTAAALEEVRKALAVLEDAVAARAPGSERDFQFHLAIARASGNNWFVDVLQAMKGQIEVAIDIGRHLSLSKPEDHLRAVQYEHVAVFDAIRQRDPDGARTAMRNHLSNTCNRIFLGSK